MKLSERDQCLMEVVFSWATAYAIAEGKIGPGSINVEGLADRFRASCADPAEQPSETEVDRWAKALAIAWQRDYPSEDLLMCWNYNPNSNPAYSAARRAIELSDERVNTAINEEARLNGMLIQERDALRAQVAEHEKRFANSQNCVCSYCGEWSLREGRSQEEFTAAIREHMLNCDKRPEKALSSVICAMALSLGVELQDMPKYNQPQPLIEAFDAAWQRICDGRDELRAQLEQSETSNADLRDQLARITEAGKLCETKWRESQAQLERLQNLLNTPEIEDFDKAVPLEAAHQVNRWGADHDAGKQPEDWFWLLGYLGGKILSSIKSQDTQKAKHHCISSSAMLRNWHAHIRTGQTLMRPGIEDPEYETAKSAQNEGERDQASNERGSQIGVISVLSAPSQHSPTVDVEALRSQLLDADLAFMGAKEELDRRKVMIETQSNTIMEYQQNEIAMKAQVENAVKDSEGDWDFLVDKLRKAVGQ